MTTLDPNARNHAAQISYRELSTILAALRLWQRAMPNIGGDEVDIADSSGETEPLADDEIDALCERLNCGD